MARRFLPDKRLACPAVRLNIIRSIYKRDVLPETGTNIFIYLFYTLCAKTA